MRRAHRPTIDPAGVFGNTRGRRQVDLRPIVALSASTALRKAMAALAAISFLGLSSAALAGDDDPTPNAFVAVELPPPASFTSGIASGTVLDVNNDGWACGWVDDGTTGSLPFVFDPTVTASAMRGTMTLLPLDSGYTTGTASALVETGAHPMLAGTVATSSGHTEAVSWTWDSSASTWDMALIFTSGTEPSEATGIAGDGTDTWICGHQKVLASGTEWGSFRHLVGGSTSMHSGTEENFSEDVTLWLD